MLTSTKDTLKCDKLDLVWGDLRDGLDQVYVRGENFGMTRERYMHLYTVLYNLFQNNERQMQLELFGRVKCFLQQHLNMVCEDGQSLAEECLLHYFTKQWDRFQFSSRVAHNIFSVLNSKWEKLPTGCRRPANWDHTEWGCGLYKLAMITWIDKCKVLSSHAIVTMLKLIKRERNGQVFNTGLLSRITDCLVHLGAFHQIEPSVEAEAQTSLSVYRNVFEQPFFAETELFYQKKSETLLATHSVTEYTAKAQQLLDEENDRVVRYLHQSTSSPLNSICVCLLVESHLDRLLHEFTRLLSDHKTDDLTRLYQLVSRVPAGLDQMKLCLESHILSQGLAQIEKCGESVRLDPKIFICTVLDVHRKYADLVQVAFQSEPGFVAALDKACGHFINYNQVTELTEVPSIKSSELLAKYCDWLLKKTNKLQDKDDLEQALSQVMIVFKYLQDKDAFEQFYCKLLAKRLALSTLVSEDAEAIMVSKLKFASGFEYTSRMKRMIQDSSISKSLVESYRQQVDFPEKALEVQIFRSGLWPFQQQLSPFTPPSHLLSCLTRFNTFYTARHNGRKLNWQYPMCNGEIVAHCFSNVFTFQASAYQMAILLQYNSADCLTVAHLHESTQIQMDLLVQVLEVLLKAKLLVDQSDNVITDSSGPTLQPNTRLALFRGYKNKKLRVNINVPMKCVMKRELDDTNKHIEEQRLIVIQAAIIRIMKMRRTVSHQQLSVELFNQVLPQFKPEVGLIKKCIAILIEREYIKRSEDNPGTFHYIA